LTHGHGPLISPAQVARRHQRSGGTPMTEASKIFRFSLVVSAVVFPLAANKNLPLPPPAAGAPAAQPAPPSPSQKPFVVYFNFDRYDLTADRQKVIDQAAAASSRRARRGARSTATPTSRARRATTWACPRSARIPCRGFGQGRHPCQRNRLGLAREGEPRRADREWRARGSQSARGDRPVADSVILGLA